MKYYKTDSGFFASPIAVESAVEISEAEYKHIKSIVDNKPNAPDGYAYRLTVDLQWELFELPIVEEDEEVSTEEVLAELMEVLE